MKNSAWYHKLWRKKFDEYPLRDDAGSSWADMEELLDQHLPVTDRLLNKKPAKFLGGTTISMLGFVLPAAAMIGAITFVAIKHADKNKVVPKHHYHNKFSPKNTADSSKTDSLTKAAYAPKADTTAPGIKENEPVTQANSPATSSGAFLKRQAIGFKQPMPGTGQQGKPINNSIANQQRPYAGNNLTPLALAEKKPDVALGTEKAPGTLNTPQRATPVTSAQPVVATGANKGRSPSRSIKTSSLKAIKSESKFDMGIDARLNISGAGTNPAFGIHGIVVLNPKWQLNTGVRIDLSLPLSMQITHPGYARPDSTAFKVTDSRKINLVTVPVNLEYLVSDRISIYAGPQISFSASQSGHSNKVGNVANYRDTIGHTHSIDSALRYNSINKVNIGVSGGVSLRVGGHFYINGTYQQNITPFKLSTGLGDNKQYYHSFQLGLRYRFKKFK